MRPDGVSDDTWELELLGEYVVQHLFTLVRWRFRELAESEGFTQQELADRMGLKRSQISRWMGSPSNMTVRTAAKLLGAMGRKLELRVIDMYGHPPCSR